MIIVRNLKIVFCSLVLVCLFGLIGLPSQYVTNFNLDPSWQNAYNYFYENSIQYGEQIEFTYGPLAPFYLAAFDPELYWMKIIFWLIIAIISCYLLVLYRRIFGFKEFTLISFSLMFCIGHDSLIQCLQLVLYLIYTKLRFERLNSEKMFLMFISLILVLFGLIKFTFFSNGLIMFVLIIIYLVRSKNWNYLIFFVFSYFSFLILFWKLLKQNIQNIYSYFYFGIEIAKGYNYAMAKTGPISAVILALILIIFVFLLLPRSTFKLNINTNYKEFTFTFYLISLILFSWKHGFVREDLHIVEFFSFISFVFAIIYALNPNNYMVETLIKQFKVKRVLAVFFVITSISAVGYSYYFQNFAQELFKSRIVMLKQVSNIITHPSSLVKNNEKLELEFNNMKNSTIPRVKEIVKKDTIDIYNYNQNYIIYNSFSWKPRPIFQSYSAYTSKLLRLNKNQLIEQMPAYTLVNVKTIDNRYPLMDDNQWFRELLHRYAPVLQEGELVLMRNKFQSSPTPTLNEIETKDIQIGGKYEFPKIESLKLTYIDLNIKYTLMGKIRNLLYKPDEISIVVDLEDGQSKTYRIIPEMLKEPILISPLIETNEDLISTLQGQNNKKVISIAVVANKSYIKRNIKLKLLDETLNNSK